MFIVIIPSVILISVSIIQMGDVILFVILVSAVQLIVILIIFSWHFALQGCHYEWCHSANDPYT
jgi:hypothetical protein